MIMCMLSFPQASLTFAFERTCILYHAAILFLGPMGRQPVRLHGFPRPPSFVMFVFFGVLRINLFTYHNYVTIGVNTSSLKWFYWSNVEGGRLGVKNCGRWKIGVKKLWEVGDWGSKYVGGGRLAPLCHPPHTCISTKLITFVTHTYLINLISQA